MKCPHCLQHIHEQERCINIGMDAEAAWQVICIDCPACHKMVVSLSKHEILTVHGSGKMPGPQIQSWLVRPKGALRPPPPAEVPKNLAEDYVEACLVLPDSAKASAALSRRCLQTLLREVAKVKPGDLFDEIQEVLSGGKLPSQLAESLDAVRHIGNFAAHPIKSKVTGEIVAVETGEAEWNLDVLEGLFDFYSVQPGILKKKKDELNKKLAAAGKTPMK